MNARELVEFRRVLEREGCRFVGSEPEATPMVGWRFWFVRVEKRGPVRLASPFVPMPTAVVGASLEARCPLHPEPPHPDCVCGLYGTPNLLDAVVYVGEVMGSPLWRTRIPNEFLPVVGRVTLSRTLRMLAPAKGGGYVTELRAGHARIDDLYLLTPTEPATDAHVNLASRLSASHGGVPCAAAWPRYTQADFDAHVGRDTGGGRPVFDRTAVRPAEGETFDTRYLAAPSTSAAQPRPSVISGRPHTPPNGGLVRRGGPSVRLRFR